MIEKSERKSKEKSPAPRGVQTLDIMVTRWKLYSCATTP